MSITYVHNYFWSCQRKLQKKSDFTTHAHRNTKVKHVFYSNKSNVKPYALWSALQDSPLQEYFLQNDPTYSGIFLLFNVHIFMCMTDMKPVSKSKTQCGFEQLFLLHASLHLKALPFTSTYRELPQCPKSSTEAEKNVH